MKKRHITKLFILAISLGLIAQVGITVYSMQLAGTSTAEPATTELLAVDTQTSTSNIVISEEIKTKIKESDPTNYERNLNNYINLLNSLNVHDKLKNEIERLIELGYKVPTILTAYEFLYHQYGNSIELESLVTKKASGKTWAEIFTEYNQNNPEFMPRAFDSDYLEDLMKDPSLTPDDIMIADRVSFETELPFQDIISVKIEQATWQQINAALMILNSADKLPYVPVTQEQITLYMGKGLTEEEVIKGFVLANKLGADPEAIINKILNDYTEEKILAESYIQKYE